MEGKVKVIPRRWAKDIKSAGTNSGKSGARNLEAESIRTGAESMGGREVTAKLHDALCTLRTWLRIKL